MSGERAPARRGLPRALLAALLAAAPLALIGPSLLPGRLFLPLHPVSFAPLATERPEDAARLLEQASYLTSDRVFPQLTDQIAVRERLLAGDWPGWEPRLGLGVPLFGGTMAAPLYPPNALALALAPERAAGPLALVALLLAGLGAWRLFGRLELGDGARLVGALTYQVGGFALANLHYGMKVDAALWLPWQLWAAEGVARRERGAGAWLAVTTALPLLAGFPPIAFFGLAATAAWCLVRAPGRARARALGWLALGVLAAGVQLVPTAEASRESTRGPRTAADLEAERLPAATLLSSVVPHLFGAPGEPVFAPHRPVAWWLVRDARAASTANPLEWNLFAGAAAVALAAAALVAAPRRALAPALLLLAALGFAQGWPGVRLAYRLPGLDLGAPARALCVAWLAWPWLAALGAQALLEGRPRARGAAVVAAVLLALGGVALARLEPDAWAARLEHELVERHGVDVAEVRRTVRPEEARAAARRLARSGAFLATFGLSAAAAALVAGALARRGRPLAAALPLAAVCALEGALVGAPHLAPRRADETALFPESPAMDALAAAAGDGRVLRHDTSPGGVAAVERLARPNLPQAYGVADLTPYVVFPPRRSVELLEALDPRTRWRTGTARLPDVALCGHPILDLARVTCVLALQPLEHPRLELVHALPGFAVHRRDGAFPVARVVPHARWMSDARAVLDTLAREPRPEREVLLVGAPADPLSDPAPHPTWEPGEVTVERPSPDRLDVRVHAGSGGWLVLHEAWYPGWVAELDGEPVPLRPADHAFRALRLPPGDHVVRTRYAPGSTRVGLGISALALLAIGAAATLPRRRGH